MRFLTLTLTTALLVGCASGIRSIDSYEDPAYSGEMDRILVLLPGLFPNAGDYAEDKLLEAFERRGIQTATRRDYFRASESLTKEKLVAALQGTDVDGVLLVDLAGSEQASRGRQSFQDARGNYGDYQDEIGYIFSTGGTGGTSYRETQTDVYLRLRLFPAETERLAWEIYLDASNPGSAFDAIDKFAPRIASEIAASGLVNTR